MPFIWKNRMDIYWSGERQVARMHTDQGAVLTYLHAPGGPSKTGMGKDGRKLTIKTVGERPQVSTASVVEIDSDGEEGCSCFRGDSKANMPTPLWKTDPKAKKTLAAELQAREEESAKLEIKEYQAVPVSEDSEETHRDKRRKTVEVNVICLVNAAYKPVHKKVKPVPTIYPEALKQKMVMPDNILADMSKVPVNPPQWSELKWTERVTEERAFAALKASEGFCDRRSGICLPGSF